MVTAATLALLLIILWTFLRRTCKVSYRYDHNSMGVYHIHTGRITDDDKVLYTLIQYHPELEGYRFMRRAKFSGAGTAQYRSE